MKRAWFALALAAALPVVGATPGSPTLPVAAGAASSPAKAFGVLLTQNCQAVRGGLVNAGLKESAVAGDGLSALFTVTRAPAAPFSKTVGVRLTCGAPGGEASEVVITLAGAASDQRALRDAALSVAPASGWRGMMFGHGNDQTLVVYQRMGMSQRPVPAAKAPS